MSANIDVLSACNAAQDLPSDVWRVLQLSRVVVRGLRRLLVAHWTKDVLPRLRSEAESCMFGPPLCDQRRPQHDVRGQSDGDIASAVSVRHVGVAVCGAHRPGRRALKCLTRLARDTR